MKNILIAGISVLVLVGLVASQAHADRINKRQRHQRARIAQGVKSGELSKGEARHLKKEPRLTVTSRPRNMRKSKLLRTMLAKIFTNKSTTKLWPWIK